MESILIAVSSKVLRYMFELGRRAYTKWEYDRWWWSLTPRQRSVLRTAYCRRFENERKRRKDGRWTT